MIYSNIPPQEINLKPTLDMTAKRYFTKMNVRPAPTVATSSESTEITENIAETKTRRLQKTRKTTAKMGVLSGDRRKKTGAFEKIIKVAIED